MYGLGHHAAACRELSCDLSRLATVGVGAVAVNRALHLGLLHLAPGERQPSGIDNTVRQLCCTALAAWCCMVKDAMRWLSAATNQQSRPAAAHLPAEDVASTAQAVLYSVLPGKLGVRLPQVLAGTLVAAVLRADAPASCGVPIRWCFPGLEARVRRRAADGTLLHQSSSCRSGLVTAAR